MIISCGPNVASLEERALWYWCTSLQKGDETMHREPLNQELVNVFNFMIIPLVMAIVLFLTVHPLSDAASPSICVNEVITCLLFP